MAKDVSLVDDLGNFAERARDLLRLTIEQGLRNDTRPNRDVVHWYIGLGTLAWDVSGSIMRLVSVSDVRAASMLNRSLFEYWIRIRFYAKYPDKASRAIRQLPTRIGKIDTAIVDIRELDALTKDERDELEQFAATGTKIERENFRNGVLEKVMSKDDADRYYDFFYGKASAWIHGYETMLADVLSDHFHRLPNPQPHWQTRRLKANDTAAVCIHNVLDVVDAIREARSLPRERVLNEKWVELQRDLQSRGHL